MKPFFILKFLIFLFCDFLIFNQASGQYFSGETSSIMQNINMLNIQNGLYIHYQSNIQIDYSNVYTAFQSRYDRNFDVIATEARQLQALDLINTENRALLNEFKLKRYNYCKNVVPTLNLSNDDIAMNVVQYCIEIYRYKSIIEEILLIQSCQTELYRIRNEDPTNYYYSQRYRSIYNTIEKLRNCHSDEIAKLSWL